jgi:hypothetical protein
MLGGLVIRHHRGIRRLRQGLQSTRACDAAATAAAAAAGGQTFAYLHGGIELRVDSAIIPWRIAAGHSLLNAVGRGGNIVRVRMYFRLW